MPKLRYVGSQTIDIVGLPGKTKKGDMIDQGHLFCVNMLRAHPDEWEVLDENKELAAIQKGAIAEREQREKEAKERLAAAEKAKKAKKEADNA